MSRPEPDAEVVVIGAGIIGLVNALQFAKRGFKVTLIDNVKGQPESFKVGESLLIFSNMFLRTIAELDDFNEGSFPKHGVWFTYGMEGATDFEGKPEWSIQSNIPEAMRSAFVDKKMLRALIDDVQIVRPEAERAMAQRLYKLPNVRFLDTARVKDVELKADGSLHQVVWYDRAAQQTGTVRTRWVIDCSGRNRFLAKRLGHVAEEAEFNDGFRNSAVWAQFSGIKDEMFSEAWRYTANDGASTTRDFSTLHLWGDGYWIWVIRLSQERISIGVSYDQSRPPPGANYQEKFWGIIRRYPIFDKMLREENVLEFNVFKNCQHCTDTFVSKSRYGLVGDAASIIDAYYSQGVSLALVTSWHIANIIEKDLRQGRLDTEYVDRVNRNTRADWQMIRNIVKFKYRPAIQDPRFFLLSHLLDMIMFIGVASPRYQLCKWLVETGGDTSREKPVHQRLREKLASRLYYSKRGLLAPETVFKLQHHWQQQLAERAQWRLDRGIKVPTLRSIIRTPGGLIPFWKLPFFKPDDRADISPSATSSPPKFLFLTGEETDPKLLRLAGPLMTGIFLLMYFHDWVDTGLHKAQEFAGRSPSRAQVGRGAPPASP